MAIQPSQEFPNAAGGERDARVGRPVVQIDGVAVGADDVSTRKRDVADVTGAFVFGLRPEDPRVAAQQDVVRDLHNVTVERESDGSLHLTMHVKLPGGMSLDAATEASAELERHLRREFPAVSRVDVHLEPLEPDLVAGADVTTSRDDLARQIREIVEGHPEVLRCPDVELSSRDGSLVAHVVAQMPGVVSLEQAHRVETELEERLRRALPELSEVVARVSP